MVIVWPELGPVPENVPVAVAPVGKAVRVSVLELLPAELVSVMVGAVVEVGKAETVPDESFRAGCTPPTTEDAVALVVTVSVFEPLVIVTP